MENHPLTNNFIGTIMQKNEDSHTMQNLHFTMNYMYMYYRRICL